MCPKKGITPIQSYSGDGIKTKTINPILGRGLDSEGMIYLTTLVGGFNKIEKY